MNRSWPEDVDYTGRPIDRHLWDDKTVADPGPSQLDRIEQKLDQLLALLGGAEQRAVVNSLVRG